MAEFTGRSITQKYLELNGMLGDFSLPAKGVKVKYFSTIASSKDHSSDFYEFLEELKPMRDKVSATELNDLSSLLQRNLDDHRVVNELLPYLVAEKPEIAFFPAILCVIIPKGFLKKNEESHYPVANQETKENGNPYYNYDELWKLELFQVNEVVTNLGILELDIKNLDVVVLDGQHRANAFRVASGTYEKSDSAVYPAFYQDFESANKIQADLPVTLIWFDVDEPQFDPRIVSRRLFVDVNNTAKRVSKARTILLDEREVPSLITRFFYSALAKSTSFKVNDFSLFHAAFDIDEDINKAAHNVFSLTDPEKIYDVVSWLTLGSRRYNNIEKYRVSREHFKNNTLAFSEIFSDEGFNENHIYPYDEYLNTKRVIIKDSSLIDDFMNEYHDNLHPILINFFRKFTLCRIHFNACKHIEDWYNENEMNTYQRNTWEEIYKGGEGLYYTFNNPKLKETGNQVLNNYLTAMSEIEKEFLDNRSSYFEHSNPNDVNKAFNTIDSKAFQVGIFMAVSLYRDHLTYLERAEELFSRLNQFTPDNWIYILTKIKNELISGLDPKKWPSFQKLFLRLIQDESEYFHAENFVDSPDGQIFSDKIKKSFDAWIENEEVDLTEFNFEVISSEKINEWSSKAQREVNELFLSIGVDPIDNVDINQEASKILKKLAKRYSD